MVRIATIFDLHRWYTQSDGQKWFTLILFFWHYLFHLFSRSLVFSSLSPISSIFLLTDNSSEILLPHSYSPITSAVLLSHRLFNPHLRISQTRRLSSRVQSHHLCSSQEATITMTSPPPPWFVSSFVFISFYLLFSSKIYCFCSQILNTDERDARQRRILT